MASETCDHAQQWERAFVVFAMLALTTHLLPELLWPNRRLGEPYMAMQVLYGGIYGAAALLAVRRWSSSLATALREPWLLAIVALAISSTLWSDAPGVTLRRGLALAGGLALAVYIVGRFSMREWITLLAWALGVGAVFSYILALVLPGVAIYPEGHFHAGDWRGMFAHKNALGIHMAFGVVAAMTVLMLRQGSRWPWVLMLVLFLMLIALSGSRTSWLLTVAAALLFSLAGLWTRISPRSRTTAIQALIAGSLLAVPMMLWLGPGLLDLLQRDLTLTGRTELWAVAWPYAMSRPFLGHGYGAFWVDWAPAAHAIRGDIGWRAPHGHNGFLDVFLGLGLAGLVLVLASLVRSSIRSYQRINATFAPDTLFLVTFLTLFVLLNIVESHTMRPNMLMWQLYVIVALYVAQTQPLTGTEPASPGDHTSSSILPATKR